MFKEELLQYRDSAVEHQFATLREIKAGKCDFNEFTITDVGPKGRGMNNVTIISGVFGCSSSVNQDVSK